LLTITFAGHREVYQSDIPHRLDALLDKLAAEQDELTFYVGGMGEFDSLAASAVRGLKHRHPEKQISLVLVEPYMKQSINEEGEYLHSLYDDIWVPSELAGVHYKKAITERNRVMVQYSDVVITYLHRDFGGAYTTTKYAKKLGKEIYNVADNGETCSPLHSI